MSTTTIIATIESDASGVLTAALGRLTALETAFAKLGPAAQTLLSDAGTSVETIVAAGATVAAEATNPAAAAVAIGGVIVPVTNAFVDIYNGIKGFIEGVEGKSPAAGASRAEVDGAQVGNLLDAFVETLVDPLLGKTPAAS